VAESVIRDPRSPVEPDGEVLAALTRMVDLLTRIVNVLERVEERQERAIALLRSLDRSQWQ
jgi:hypothetical protein